MKNNKNNKRKMAVAVLAGLALTGLVGASAASLGGIDGSLGADAAEVISCDTNGVDVSYDTTFVSDNPLPTDEQGYFNVASVVVSDVNPTCDGLDFEIKLLDDANVAIGSAAGTVDLESLTDLTTAVDDFRATVTTVLPATAVDAEFVTGIAITISGPTTP